MADAESESVSSEQKQSENKEYDPSLDFFSEHFDPLKALTTPGVIPPVINATTYDNLAQYEQAHSDQSKQRTTVKAGSSKSTVIPEPERKWLPHQLPIKTERTFPTTNVLTRMEAMTGPLGLLKKCKDERIRIKVWTRHSHNIRGYCIGFITLFDKHWNFILEDVTEVWTRPKHRKIPAALDNISSNKFNRKRLVPPPITVIQSTGKTETCERHIDQFLIRGEQIAIVQMLPKD